MTRQFLVVNNGMTGLRGHYYETAVSVADEARARGLCISVAAHASCPAVELPGGLTLLPIFRVDHFAARVLDPDGAAPAPGSRWRKAGEHVASVARRLVSPGVYLGLRAGLRRLRARVRHRPVGMIDLPPAAGVQPGILADAAARLAEIEQSREAHLVRLFHDDLALLLERTGAGPDDDVFLPTAHGREVLAVRHLLACRPGWLPRFHLELRHAVTASGRASGSEGDYDILPYTWLHQIYFDAVRRYPPTDRLHLYTDTDELAAEYATLAGMPFAVLPIPFRTGLFPPARPRTGGPLTMLFLGDCRRDKGFHLLPHLVKVLAGEPVRWVMQASLHPDEQAAMAPAVAELRNYPESKVRLIGDGTFLAPEAYYQELVDSDVVLCPYRPERYRLCSSGVFSEAVAAGKPTVVPQGTWLSAQQTPGSGETFHDSASLAEAVRRICRDFEHYRERALVAKERWLARHSPATLVDFLLGTGSNRVGRAG